MFKGPYWFPHVNHCTANISWDSPSFDALATTTATADPVIPEPQVTPTPGKQVKMAFALNVGVYSQLAAMGYPKRGYMIVPFDQCTQMLAIFYIESSSTVIFFPIHPCTVLPSDTSHKAKGCY